MCTTYHFGLLSVLLLAGCHSSTSRLGKSVEPKSFVASEPHFWFLQLGMPLHEVTAIAGYPTRRVGSGQERWEYDLADGSRIIIFPGSVTSADEGAWTVSSYGQQKGTNWLWVKYNDSN